MTTTKFDLGYLETAVDLLQNYLLSKDLYWKMNASSPPGEPGYPSLTLGAVLLSQARLAARSLTPSEESQIVKLQNQLEGIRSKWRSAWGGKAREEFRYRLNLWRNFLEEFREDPHGNFDRYSYEVSRRVMLDLLSQEADYIPPEQEQLLKGLDRILEGLMLPGNFVWDQALAGGFSSEVYPYLYSRLRK